MTEQADHSAECATLWCPDCDRTLDHMVKHMTMLYAVTCGLPDRSLLTVQVVQEHDIFTLRIGVGRDAAAWLDAAARSPR